MLSTPAWKLVPVLILAGLAAGLAVATGLLGRGEDQEPFSVKEGRRMLVGFADSSANYPYPGAPDAEQLAALQAAAGGEVGRFTIRWETVQPEPPERGEDPDFDWSGVEPLIEALADEGIAPLPVLLGAPAWARDPSPSCRVEEAICPPRAGKINHYADFAAAVADEFGGQGLAGVEIWNEPNLAAFWQTEQGPSAGRYAELFGAAREAVRAVDPELRILVGGLALPRSEGSGTDDVGLGEFLEGFYAAIRGSAPIADLDDNVALSFHPYPAVPGKQVDLFQQTIDELLAATADDPGRELWATEVGLSTTDPRGGKPPSETEQAQAVLSALGRLEAVDAVQVALVYTVVDRPAIKADIGQSGYGIVRRGPGFEPKQTYCEIAAARQMPAPQGC